jgi:hypothetical protein
MTLRATRNLHVPIFPGSTRTCTCDQLIGMSERISGCTVELDAVISREFATSMRYQKILISDTVPDEALAETLLSAVDHLVREHFLAPWIAPPLLPATALPPNVALLRHRN